MRLAEDRRCLVPCRRPGRSGKPLLAYGRVQIDAVVMHAVGPRHSCPVRIEAARRLAHHARRDRRRSKYRVPSAAKLVQMRRLDLAPHRRQEQSPRCWSAEISRMFGTAHVDLRFTAARGRDDDDPDCQRHQGRRRWGCRTGKYGSLPPEAEIRLPGRVSSSLPPRMKRDDERQNGDIAMLHASDSPARRTRGPSRVRVEPGFLNA